MRKLADIIYGIVLTAAIAGIVAELTAITVAVSYSTIGPRGCCSCTESGVCPCPHCDCLEPDE